MCVNLYLRLLKVFLNSELHVVFILGKNGENIIIKKFDVTSTTYIKIRYYKNQLLFNFFL